ncbi:N-acetyltransferase [Allostella humosa]|nr:N-acetyltransferase [Stella humosa]
MPALFAFMGDAEAMQHTHRQRSLRACRRHVAGHEWQRRRTGIAPWTVRALDDDRIVGWGGLYNDPFDPGWGVEIAYYFTPDCWGRGYASELTRASLEVARAAHGLGEVVAFAHPDNPGSRRVLEKAGFVAERFLPDMQRHFFRRRL